MYSLRGRFRDQMSFDPRPVSSEVPKPLETQENIRGLHPHPYHGQSGAEYTGYCSTVKR